MLMVNCYWFLTNVTLDMIGWQGLQECVWISFGTCSEYIADYCFDLSFIK